MNVDIDRQCAIGGCTNNATRELQFKGSDRWYSYCDECTAVAETETGQVSKERRLPEAKR